MKKNIFIFDENKCVGCHACVVACINENGFQSPERWRNVLNSNPNLHPGLPLFYLSLACNHCDEAPCMYNCPSKAFYKDEVTGAIVHDPDRCMGCKYCTWACPYDAPKFNPSTGLIEKCTFCNERIEEGLKPACTQLCPVGALEFNNEEFTKEDALISSPVPVNIGSSLKIIKRRRNQGPIMDVSLIQDPDSLKKPDIIDKKISARKEWPLLIFSLLSSIMVALFFAKEKLDNSVWQRWMIPSLGILAATFSFLHLGKRQRSWKVVLNVEKSWLSREILFFGFFFITMIIDLFFYDLPETVIVVNGLLLLISIDMLYMLATWKWKLKIHSAQVIFIAASLWLLVMGYELAFILFTVFRGGLFTFQKGFMGSISEVNKNLGLLRILLPLITISLVYFSVDLSLIIISVLATDLIDRIEFYGDLRVPVPAEEIRGKNADNTGSTDSRRLISV